MNESLPPRSPVADTLAAPHRLTMGLTGLREHEPWLEIDADLADDLREKRRLLREHREQVSVELPSSREAQREAFQCVSEAAARDLPGSFEFEGPGLRVQGGELQRVDDALRTPLESAALCVQEDLCVMQQIERAWCLTAGVVCFPTRWDLPAQLGRPMTDIHERVPGYRSELDRSANRFFDGMKAGRVFRRGNWSLLDDPALFLPTGKHRSEKNSAIDADSAGERVWLRVEHQTLQRMPKTGAVLFGIRIHRTRLDAIAADAQTARTLIEAVRTMPPPMQLYKSLALVKESALAYLERRLEASRGARQSSPVR